MSVGIIVIVFLVLFAIVLVLVSIGLKFVESQRKKRVGELLQTVSSGTPVQQTSILQDQSEGVGLFSVVAELPVLKRLQAKIQQGGLTWSAGGVVMAMCAAGVVGSLLGLRVRVPVFREFAMATLGFGFAMVPYLYVAWKRRQRLNEFEQQFPEALDFLARSMRAGHAFSVSLEMMADESPDPLGPEIRQVYHEQNLGAPLDVALRNLVNRVPLVDVRFFVSAVLMQRETGGNLAEILTKLAFVIRERFRLKGQVRAVSAHGRITALILSVMPIFTMMALFVVAPGYLEGMAADPDGKLMIIGSILGQFLGYYWMKRIIDIKV
jgi:tight adherence protein B